MEEAIAIFAAINFAVIGLSHCFQSRGWNEFFQQLHAMGRAGAFVNGMLTLLMGSLIVAFHNVWTGVPILLTLIGWAYILKSTVIFLNPDWGLRSMKSIENASPLKWRIVGAVLITVALVIAWCVASGQYGSPEMRLVLVV
ncbi:MAG: hypothetical protein ACYTGQ_09735 [Planctomycetota bacterium]|jgi:uncharacterized protein YjeT (DUF2065 family)